ncbi:mucolipin-2 [Silurus asotus]|uniref:Chloride channel CLIC-like protein 1 n=1 Tax=Silurus asotus TaxID=30991 RepID=A0AAD5FSN9_SILAS|nr:mucolipin-2 [Silurus asotus]
MHKCTGGKEIGLMDAFKEWFHIILTCKDDPCKKYYEDLIVNPILLAPPHEALKMTITMLINDPLKYLGECINKFLRASEVDMMKAKCTIGKEIDWMDAFKEWIYIILTCKDDPCKKYYEDLIIDPILLAPPHEFLTVPFSNPMSVNLDQTWEESLRDDLRYYFMSPCEKYKVRRQLPWKLTVQILKIIMITTQLILFGLNNQLVVSYKEENLMAFKNIFLKSYGGVEDDDYTVAVYTKQSVSDHLYYIIDQYSLLDQLSVGSVSYAEEDGKLLPLVVCKEYYRRGSGKASEETYDIDAQTDSGYYCDTSFGGVRTSKYPIHLHIFTVLTRTYFSSNRLVGIEISFRLNGINLQTVLSHELPDCYIFAVLITFDNRGHSGKVKITLDFDAVSSACKNWKISGTAQKSTHYLLIFDAAVILVCLTSAVLCVRSIYLAIRLLQRFSKFCVWKYNHKVCEEDQWEFLNGWYILVIISDVLAIVGSVLKMEIQAKSLTSYDVCSIFLGTSTLMVWVGVIRYLGYFRKYNVLILTMQAALPNVLRFCCCAGMIYLGYTFCGWIVLGPYHEKFEGLSRVAECLFSLVNGDDMFPTFAEFKQKNTVVWLFSRVYLYSFISLFIYMVLSLFIALITDAYESIKRYQKNGFPMTELQLFLNAKKEFPQGEDVENGEGSRTKNNFSFTRLCNCRR